MVVFFLRGLNTFNDDQVHLGPVALGPMSRYLEMECKKHNVKLVGISGMGRGTFAEQAARAKEAILREHPEDQRIHLLGHSAGGLIARALYPQLSSRREILSITTLATPHAGSLFATRIVENIDRNAWKMKLVKAFGYNAFAKRQDFLELSLEALKKFNETYPPPPIPCFSLQFSMPYTKIPWAYKMGFRQVLKKYEFLQSDGMVELGSQYWQKSLGHFTLDHMAQLGYVLSMNPSYKRKAQQTFQDICLQLVRHWRQTA